MRHPYLSALRQLLLDLLPRPSSSAQLGGAATPGKRAFAVGNLASSGLAVVQPHCLLIAESMHCTL
jgi:hypothetical protein